jgi:hypothetical protein
MTYKQDYFAMYYSYDYIHPLFLHLDKHKDNSHLEDIALVHILQPNTDDHNFYLLTVLAVEVVVVVVVEVEVVVVEVVAEVVRVPEEMGSPLFLHTVLSAGNIGWDSQDLEELSLIYILNNPVHLPHLFFPTSYFSHKT